LFSLAPVIPACDFDRGSGLGAVGRIIPRGLSGQCWICPAQQARPETSSGTQTEKLLSGEYTVGFFISAAPAYPVVAKSGGLLKVVLPPCADPGAGSTRQSQPR